MTMVVLDMSTGLVEIITDVIYTIVLQSFNFLKRKEWIKSYRVTDSRSNATVATNNEKKLQTDTVFVMNAKWIYPTNVVMLAECNEQICAS